MILGYVDGHVEFGVDCHVAPQAYLRGPLVVGHGTRVWPHAVIGTEGEHRRAESVGTIRIGSYSVVREFVAIQRGTGERETSVGDRAYLMNGSHVAHDCVLGDDVTTSPKVVLGGHTRVHRGATIGISAMTHQHTTVGAYAMIGMGSVVTRDVPPFCLVVGNPARFVRFNVHGARAAGIDPDCLFIHRGQLASDHHMVRELLAAFEADCRRKPIELTLS
jgi:UDP-N-acetylglucosamine acyltransferase